MAKKHTFIYRLEAGYDQKPPEIIEFFYATNSKQLTEYAKELYKDKKYNKYVTTKLGITKEPRPLEHISDFESWYLRQNMTADFYSERIEP